MLGRRIHRGAGKEGFELSDSVPAGRRVGNSKEKRPDDLVVEIGAAGLQLIVEPSNEVAPTVVRDPEEAAKVIGFPINLALHERMFDRVSSLR